MEGSKKSTGKDKSADGSVYYDPHTDPTRPRYERPTGEVGITIDVYDAVTRDPKEFHSHHALLTTINDRLYELVNEVPLEQLKGAFLEQGLLQDVILQQVHKGLILSVCVESPEGLEGLWRAQSHGDIHRVLQQSLITPDVLERARVHKLELRVRLWEDERTACLEDLKQMRVSERSLDKNAVACAMVDRIKRCKKKIPDGIWRLRDEQAKFERDLSEMLRLLKGVMPGNRQTITSLAVYEKCCATLRSKTNINMKPFLRYKHILNTARMNLSDIQTDILYSMYQIQSCFQTSKQKENRKSIKDIIQSAQKKLEEDFDFSVLRHHEWQNRLLANEERFLGFVSLVPMTLDALVDIDECLDEYMSGFKSK